MTTEEASACQQLASEYDAVEPNTANVLRAMLGEIHRLGTVESDLRAELSRLRSAPVAVPVMSTEDIAAVLRKVMIDMKDGEGLVSIWTANRISEWFCERVKLIDPSRILKDRERAVPGELLRFALDALRCSDPYVGCGYDHSAKYTTAIARLEDALRSGEAEWRRG